MASSPEEIRKHTRQYLLVFGALAVLTVLTVAVSLWESENHAVNVAIGLTIATVKATLVALVFMHLSSDWQNRMIKIFLIFAAVFFIALMFLTLWGKFDPIKAVIGA